VFVLQAEGVLQPAKRTPHNITKSNKSFESAANFKHGLTEKLQLQLWCKIVGHYAFGLL
jgi:hypothetical protein